MSEGLRSEPLLQVEDLSVEFVTDAGIVRAVDGVSLDIHPGETLALVGESGCGKSVTAMAILGLLPMPPARIASGRILLAGEDLIAAGEDRLREVRGNDVAMIFQEPMTSLNPVFTVGDQIAEAIVLHRGVSQAEARSQTIALLDRVGMPAPGRRVDEYPHQLSGGMCQRVMIAMALACNPLLLIADEPTTALDVTIQAQILDLLRELQRDLGMSVLLITHDLGVVAQMAHRVAVMYAGRVVEHADVGPLFKTPRHPYTAGLFRSIPEASAGGAERPLQPIEGSVPDALDFPAGCKFHPRCSRVLERCRVEEPVVVARGDEGHDSACWYVDAHPDEDLLR